MITVCDPDFAFDTPELQILYQLLCQNGEVTSQDLSEQPEGVQHAWYRMVEEDLPEEIADGELEEVEENGIVSFFAKKVNKLEIK